MLWVSWGHQVKWFSALFNGAKPHETIDGIDIYRAGGEYTVYTCAPLAYWRHMLDCDVLLDAENGIPFFTPLFSRRPKAILMFHVHRGVLLTELPKPLNYIAWSLEALLMPLIYRNVPFIAISESTRDDILTYRYTQKPVEIVHSGVDHAPLSDTLKKSGHPRIVYIGRIVRYKRVPALIEQFARVLEVLPNSELIIAGQGDDMSACETTVEKLGLFSSVQLQGWVDDERKRELLQSSWVFAHPSSIEGWGITIMEAAACKTPSVAMRVRGLKDAIVDGKTGILADSWKGFGDALISILTDHPIRENLSSAAFEHSMEFSWKKSAQKTLRILEALIP